MKVKKRKNNIDLLNQLVMRYLTASYLVINEYNINIDFDNYCELVRDKLKLLKGDN